MKTIAALVTALFALSSHARAGFGGNGVTAVPITEGGLDKTALEFFDRASAAWVAGGMAGPAPTYPPFEDVPPARIAQLQAFPPFAGKSNQQVIGKVRQMRRALICAINLIELDNREAGNALLRLLRQRKICFGLTSVPSGLGMSIFPDGKKDFGIEPINVFYEVCTNLSLTDPDLFVFYNALSHESLHGQQDILKPSDGTNLAEAVDLQCRELEAHEAEVVRICEMIRVIDSILATGRIPADARGATASFGAAIAASGNPGVIAALWRSRLAALKPVGSQLVDFRRIYKTAGQAALDGDLDAAAIRQRLRPFTPWVEIYGGSRDFGPITTVIFNVGAPTINGPKGSRTVAAPGGGMKQILPGTLTPVTIDVPAVDVISDAGIDEANNRLFIVGVKYGTPDIGVVGYYDLHPTTKAVMPGTLGIAYQSPGLRFGAQLLHNDHDTINPYYLFAYGIGEIYRLTDGDLNGIPDGAVSVGFLPQMAHWEIRATEFIDAHTISGQAEPIGTAPTFTSHVSRATRPTPGADFYGLAPDPWKDYYESSPAIAGLAYDGRTDLPVVGTPHASYEVRFAPAAGTEFVVAKGEFGWSGFDCPGLSQPIGQGHGIRIVDDKGWSSAILASTPAPINTPTFIGVPQVRDGMFSAIIGSWPNQPIRAEVSGTLNIWAPAPVAAGDAFGESVHLKDAFPTPNAPETAFYRYSRGPSIQPPGGGSRRFTVTPGVPAYIDLSRPGDTGSHYYLLGPAPLNENLFSLKKNGALEITALNTGGPVTFTYHVSSGYPGALTSASTSITVDVDVSSLTDPEPWPADNPSFVTASVLPINGRHYPQYQFRLSNSKGDLCTDPHWHADDPVFSLEMITEGISEGDPECGFGIRPELEAIRLTVTKVQWDAFRSKHP